MENKAIRNPSRNELITDFVKSNPDYYIKEFKKIGSKPTYSFSFNLFAFILGPIWFGMRNVWNWTLAFLIIETFSVVQISEVCLVILLQTQLLRLNKLRVQ